MTQQNGGDEEDKKVDKRNWGAAELEKVSDLNDSDNANMNATGLDDLISEGSVAQKKITIKKEDLQLLINELELSEVTARQELIAHDGDVRAAMRSILSI